MQDTSPNIDVLKGRIANLKNAGNEFEVWRYGKVELNKDFHFSNNRNAGLPDLEYIEAGEATEFMNTGRLTTDTGLKTQQKLFRRITEPGTEPVSTNFKYRQTELASVNDDAFIKWADELEISLKKYDPDAVVNFNTQTRTVEAQFTYQGVEYHGTFVDLPSIY